MHSSPVIFSIFLIFAGAAVLATCALYARQAMIIAYIVLGVLLGPWGGGLIDDPGWIEEVSEIGIMFLLYLLGINMLPRQLWQMLGEALVVTVGSCAIFTALGVGIAFAFGFVWYEALLIGGTMMFSSTIIGLKLLPTTTLHHQHTGQVIISILLLQDLFAIVMLMVVEGYGLAESPLHGVARQFIALPTVIAVAYVLERWIIEPLIRRFDQIQEYIFLLVIAWCLGIAELAASLGLSHEIGAFVAGVALASCPVSMFIADSLRPLRDFFLILFFFSLGAGFDPAMLREILLPGCVLAGLMLLIKPLVFRWLLEVSHEQKELSKEIGVRLGQLSEFSLLIAVLAFNSGFIAERAAYVIQLATLVSFVASSYWIVLRYPTPIAVVDHLRRD